MSTSVAGAAALRKRLGSCRPSAALFAVAVLFGALQAAPGVSTINGLFGIVYLPAAGAWLLLVVAGAARTAHPGAHKATLLAISLAAVGIIGTATNPSPDALTVYARTVVGPLLLFLGVQLLDARELDLARNATRWVLFGAVALQSWYYLEAAGAQAFTPSFVFDHHANITWWSDVGSRVLANPNNASVIFCAAFAWAVAERAMRAPGRLSGTFVLLSGFAVWATGSRGAIVTAVLMLALAFAWRHRVVWLAWMSAVLAVVGSLVVTDVAESLSFATRNLEDSVSARIGARGAALDVVVSNPVGTGAGTAAETLRPALGSVFSQAGLGATSHDMFLNWGVGIGWVGLLLLLLALVGAVRGSWPHWVRILPLVGFLVAAQSAGIDVLTRSNNAWAVMLWVLIGLAWRGGALRQAKPERPAEAKGQVSGPAEGDVRRGIADIPGLPSVHPESRI